MSASEIIALAAGGIMTIITGVVLYLFKSYIADLKKYRTEREEKEQAKDDLILGLARVSLMDNYEKCIKKGYYSLDDREVYGKLFTAYVKNGGDGVIDQLAPKLRMLPTEKPERQGAVAE